MNAVRDGNFEEALRLTRIDNPIAATLGRVCDHLCEGSCIRTHIDEPLAIRDIKRFIMDHETQQEPGNPVNPQAKKVAIIGAGPGGMAAALELAQDESALARYRAALESDPLYADVHVSLALLYDNAKIGESFDFSWIVGH